MPTRDDESSAPGARTALVLGLTGGFGQAVAQALARQGWTLRTLHRNPDRAAATLAHSGLQVQWRQGDAQHAGDVLDAARGVDLIVHGLNPPRYQNWRELAVPMLEHTIAAARATGARIVFPGNIYVFGRAAPVLLGEATVQRPSTRKGQVRWDMEQMLQQASAQGVRVLILRAGDFFGPAGVQGSWFGSAMVRPGTRLRSVVYPGAPDVGHSWAYLPDVGAAVARLLEPDVTLAPFDVFHFEGHWLESAPPLLDAIDRSVGRHLPVRHLPWMILRILAPFSGLMRELIEMRYLWVQPFRLDNRKLRGAIGAEPRTPLDDAVRATLAGLGCS